MGTELYLSLGCMYVRKLNDAHVLPKYSAFILRIARDEPVPTVCLGPGEGCILCEILNEDCNRSMGHQ